MSAASLASYLVGKLKSDETATGDMSNQGRGSPTPRLTAVWRAKSIPFDIPDANTSFRNEGSLLRLLRTKSMPLLGIAGTTPPRQSMVPPQGQSPARSQSPSPVRRPTSHTVYTRNMSSGHLSDASESTVPSVATPPPTPRSPSPSGPRRRSASDGHLWLRRKKQMRRATDKAAVTLPSVKNLRGKFDEKLATPFGDKQLPDDPGHADGDPLLEDSETDEGQEGRRVSRHYSLVRREVKTPERRQPPKAAVTPANVRKLLEKFETSVQDEDEVFSGSGPQDLRSKCRSEAALKTTASEVPQEDQTRRRTSLTSRQRTKNHRRSKSEPDPSAVLQYHSQSSPPSVKKLKMMFERESMDKGDREVSREGTPERTVLFQRQKEKTPEPPQTQAIARKATEETAVAESRAADTLPAVKVSHMLATGTPSVRSLRQRFEQGASAQSSVKTVDEEVAPSTRRAIAHQLKTPFEKSERQKSRSVSPEKENRQSLTSCSSASVKNLMRQFEALSPAEAQPDSQGTMGHDLRSPRSPPPNDSKKFQAQLLDHVTGEAQQTLEVEMDSTRQHRRLRRQSQTSSSESSSGDEWKEEEELRRRKVMEQERVRKEQEEAKERQRIEQEEKMLREKRERQRIEKEEKERIMQEKERREKERMDLEREAREKEEEERRTKEILEKARKEKEKLDEERKMKERAEEERIAEEKEREAKQKLEKERKMRERAEQERLAKEEKEREAKQKLEEERKMRERAEQERLAKEEKEREAKQKLEEKKMQERAEQERLAKEEKEREAKQKLEEKKMQERAEQERLAKEEKEREAKQKLEEERKMRERAEEERKMRERAEQERLAKEEKERKERELLQQKNKEKEERERREKEKKEREEEERKEKERAKHEKEMREKAEEERKEREKIEREKAQEEEKRKKREREEAEKAQEEKRKKREREEAERLQNELLEKKKKEEERKSREEVSSSSDEEMPKKVGGEATHDTHENKPDKATDRKVHDMIGRFTHLGQRSDDLPPDDSSPPQGKASAEQRVDRLIDQFTNLRDADLEKDVRKGDGNGHEGEEGRRCSDVAALVNKFRKINERRKSSSSSDSDSESDKSREKPVKEEAPIPTIPARTNVPGKVRTLREDEMRFFNSSGGAAEPFMRTQSLRVKKSEQSSFSQPRFGSLRGSKSRVAVLSTSTTTNAALPHNCRRLNTDELRFFTGEVTNIYRSKTTKPCGRAGKTGRGDGRPPAVPRDNALPDTEEFFRIAGRADPGGEPNGRPAPGEDDSDSEPSVLRGGDDVVTDSEEDIYEMDINLRSDADTEDASDTEHHYDLDHPLSQLVHSIQGELLQPVTSEDCKEAESRCYVVFSPKSYLCSSSSEDEDENKTFEFTFVSQTPKENVPTPTFKENGISPEGQVQEGTLYDAPGQAMMSSTPKGSRRAGEGAHKDTEGDDHTPQSVISTYSNEKDPNLLQIMDFSQHGGLTTTENGAVIDFLWETKGDSQPLEELKGFVLTDRETDETEETDSRESGPSLLTCEKRDPSGEERVEKEEVNTKRVNLLEECSEGHGPADSQLQEDQRGIAAFLDELDELNSKPPNYKPPPPPTKLCENRYQRMDDSDSSSYSSSEDDQRYTELSAEDVRGIEQQIIPESSFQGLLVCPEGPSSTPRRDDDSPGTAKDVRDKKTPSQDAITPTRTTEDLFIAKAPSGSQEGVLTNSFKDSLKKENEEVVVEKEDNYISQHFQYSETQEVEKNREEKENTTVLGEADVDQQAIAAFLDELDKMNYKPPNYKPPPPPKKLRENPYQRMDDADSSSDSSSDSGSEDGQGYTGLRAEDVRSIEEQIIPEASFQGLLACPEGPSSTPPGDDGSPGTTKELRDTEAHLQDTITPMGTTGVQECSLTYSSNDALNKEEKDDHTSEVRGNNTILRGQEAEQTTEGEQVEDIISGREFIKFCIFSIWFSLVMYFFSDVLS